MPVVTTPVCVSHPDISGLTLSGSSVSLPPLSQYADDTSIIVTSIVLFLPPLKFTIFTNRALVLS